MTLGTQTNRNRSRAEHRIQEEIDSKTIKDRNTVCKLLLFFLNNNSRKK